MTTGSCCGLTKIVPLVLLALLATAIPARAQEPVPWPEYEQRFDELAKWFREYRAWEQWFGVWGNKVVHNFDGQPIWDREKRPAPPVWLAAECQNYLGVDDLLSTACYLLDHWDEEPLLILQRRESSLMTSAGKAEETVVHSSFFRRLHVTGMWPQARYPAPPAYSIVGIQIGVFETGRLTVPAVGVMVVMSSLANGNHDWHAATTIGFGYRIGDFVAPIMKKPFSLHFNVAIATVHGVQGPLDVASNLSLFGLSVSPERHHR